MGASRRPEYVRFRLTGDPPWRTSRRRRLALFQRTDPAAVASLETLRRQLETLAKDPRILGVIFELDGLEGPPAKREALLEMFKRVRAAGKKVIGYGVSVSNSEYEVLCGADRIVIPAAGRIELTGFSAEATAIGGALSKLGIKPHFLRRGEYKTAPEMFTREDISPAQRETIERLLDERYRWLVERVAEGRSMTPEDARRRIDIGPFSARRAKAQGLIDDLSSDPDLPFLLAPEGRKPEDEDGRPEARVGTWSKYVASRIWPPMVWKRVRPELPIGVVPINGMIAEGRGGTLPAGPVVAGSISIISALDKARRNPRIPAVVVYVSSPGGSAPASEMILDAVKRLARKKPVVAYFDRVAASGGYMAACGAKEIWGGPGAIAGSIGVFGGKFDVSGLMDRIGVHRTLITRGENSAIDSPSRGFTEHERRSPKRRWTRPITPSSRSSPRRAAARRRRLRRRPGAGCTRPSTRRPKAWSIGWAPSRTPAAERSSWRGRRRRAIRRLGLHHPAARGGTARDVAAALARDGPGLCPVVPLASGWPAWRQSGLTTRSDRGFEAPRGAREPGAPAHGC